MNLLEVKYTNGNEKVIEVQTEEDFLQFVTALCWERFQWTPLLEICDGIVFVHSDTWQDDFYSETGCSEWLRKDIDIEHDSDITFFMKLQIKLEIQVRNISGHN
ncbi:hypothetical protein QK289_15815 [Exiguobacterium antarcticum]|uniref:Uncharacterized protein n=1 Tax=Exiguobacterium antarcticum TaxID=132920 RepID=A0ABT6R6A2_9BACL|nr:hypothetical protein [Exiguobacterium antarcticum]MDI3236479.1 hypothetical protein [Exiguobacterium antarcticum]